MPMVKPGFGNGAAIPTIQNLEQLRQVGLLPVQAYADVEHFKRGNGFTDNVGRPKFWCNPYATVPQVYIFAKQDEDGNYLTEKPSRYQAPGNRFWHFGTWSWFDERIMAGYDIQAPQLDIQILSPIEARRLSFGPEIEGPPIDYPLAVATEDGPNGMVGNTWPGDWIVLIENGVPTYYTLREASEKYKIDRTPRPASPTGTTTAPSTSGVSPAQVVSLVRKLNAATSARRYAQTIIDDGLLTDQAKVAALLKL